MQVLCEKHAVILPIRTVSFFVLYHIKPLNASQFTSGNPQLFQPVAASAVPTVPVVPVIYIYFYTPNKYIGKVGTLGTTGTDKR